MQELETIGPIIEIGTLFGRSTLVIAANKALERKLITVDNYSWNPIGLDADTHYRITKNLLSETIYFLDYWKFTSLQLPSVHP